MEYLIVSVFAELFGLLFATLIIDYKIFGRKNSMIIFYALTAVFSLMTYFMKEYFLIMGTLCKVSMAVNLVFCF